MNAGAIDLFSSLEQLTVVNDMLFFVAVHADGDELWKSDGSEVGTRLLKDIYFGPNDPP